MTLQTVDVVVLGAGAAGMFCAAEAGRRGRSVVVIDHAAAPGEKIRISGGGRCNFTNRMARPAAFLSDNPSFCISALSRYTAADFVALVERRGIAYHEKTLGQLFCDGSSRQIIDLLVREMLQAGVELKLATAVTGIAREAGGFTVTVSGRTLACQSLVVATGGKSIPKMGASRFGYEVAVQFGLRLTETRPALVPLTFETGLLERTAPMAGIGVNGAVSHGPTRFEEGLLFTHRGLSGPAILQISSYWREGDEIVVALAPTIDVVRHLREARTANPKLGIATVLASLLPQRLAQFMAEQAGVGATAMAAISDRECQRIATAVNGWRVKPVGSEGYRTAEVTLGGIDTRDLDSRTMVARAVRGLYFIGEVVDVTGWLGGYNFQWAWSSGWAAGQAA